MGGTGDEHPLQLENGAPMTNAAHPINFDFSDVVFPPADEPQARIQCIGLYLMVSAPFVKVGVSANPIDRLLSAATMNPHDVHMPVAYWIPQDIVRTAETFCHVKLMPWHHAGEWFRIDPQQARWLVFAIADKACASRGLIPGRVNLGDEADQSPKLGQPRPAAARMRR